MLKVKGVEVGWTTPLDSFSSVRFRCLTAIFLGGCVSLEIRLKMRGGNSKMVTLGFLMNKY